MRVIRSQSNRLAEMVDCLGYMAFAMGAWPQCIQPLASFGAILVIACPAASVVESSEFPADRKKLVVCLKLAGSQFDTAFVVSHCVVGLAHTLIRRTPHSPSKCVRLVELNCLIEIRNRGFRLAGSRSNAPSGRIMDADDG